MAIVGTKAVMSAKIVKILFMNSSVYERVSLVQMRRNDADISSIWDKKRADCIVYCAHGQQQKTFAMLQTQFDKNLQADR